jgi:hypothetical protein
MRGWGKEGERVGKEGERKREKEKEKERKKESHAPKFNIIIQFSQEKNKMQ